MKRLFCLAIIVALGLAIPGMVSAQVSPIDKGSKILDGGLSFSSYGGNLYTGQTILTIDPLYGVFVGEGILLGGRILIQRNSADRYSSLAYGVGPEARYYFQSGQSTEIRGSMYLFLKGGLAYFLGNTDDGYRERTYTEFLITVGGGTVHMLSEIVSLNLEIDYNFENYKPDGSNDYTSGHFVDFSLGFSFFLY